MKGQYLDGKMTVWKIMHIILTFSTVKKYGCYGYGSQFTQ
jgi:hypothetical protein